MGALVTVIIPLFNREDFIHHTVRSVLTQSYHHLELFVVDDGSTDNGLNIVTEMANHDPRVSILSHPNGENRGQSASINLGLLAANGEYICVLDSDDYWDPTFVESLAKVLDNDSDVGLVYCNGQGVNAKEEYLYDLLSISHAENNQPGLLLENCYFCLPSASMVRTQFYQHAGGYNEAYRTAQDHDMAIRLAEIAKLDYWPEKLMSYRRHENSISQKGLRSRWLNGFKILDAAIERYPYSKKTVNKRRAVLNYRMGIVCFQDRTYIQAVTYFFLAFYYDPIRALAVVFRYEKAS